MSKVKGENKSARTLAIAMLKKCRENYSEHYESKNCDSKEEDCEGKFLKVVQENLLEYYRFVNNGRDTSYGQIPDDIFQKLKEKLSEISGNYPIDKLCEWFKVKNWKDLFPDDYESIEELKMKQNMFAVMKWLGEELEPEKRRKSDLDKIMLTIYENIKLYIYTDYIQRDKEEEIKELMTNEEAMRLRRWHIDRELNVSRMDSSERFNQVRQIYSWGRKIQIARNYIKMKVLSQSDIYRIELWDSGDPLEMDFLDQCAEEYQKEKLDIIDDKDKFTEWVKKKYKNYIPIWEQVESDCQSK